MDNTEKVRKSKMFAIGDILIAVILIAAIILSIVLFLQPDGETVNIYSDGKLIGSYPLNEEKEITVYYYGGQINTVRISDGKVTVTYSNCPDHTCEFLGPISKVHNKIICVPNKLVVEITGISDVEAVT